LIKSETGKKEEKLFILKRRRFYPHELIFYAGKIPVKIIKD